MKSAAVCARLVTDDATGASFRWVSAETCKNRIDGDIPGLVVAVVYSLSFRLRRGGWLFFFPFPRQSASQSSSSRRVRLSA